MKPISVVMAVYNESPSYLSEAVDSVLGQSFSDFEFIIILDNPQNEELKKVLAEYKRKDSRISVFVNEKNRGLALSLNRGISLSKGKYIARMDADDVSLPDRFEKQILYLEKNHNVDILATNKTYIDENSQEKGHGKILPESHEKIAKILKYINILCHPSVMMRRDRILEIGGYRNLPTSQDRDLWNRAIISGLKINILNDFLIKYRINTSGISISKAYKQALVSLYISRLNSGKYNFSEKHLNAFLEENHVDDKRKIEKFEKARVYYEKARCELKNKRIVFGIYILIKSCCMHPLIRKRVRDVFIVSLIKKIYIK